MRLITIPKLRSPELHNYRDLIVALPPSYDTTDNSYPVVYMHDGQNLFDPATSYAGAWGLVPVLEELAPRGVEAIVVGIANARSFRRFEYSPFRDPEHGGGEGDAYLEFVTERVRPLIEERFRAARDPGRTVIAGSSMGGLISLYALFRRPDVFGAAGAFSPSSWFAKDALLGSVTPPADGARAYLDVGEAEPPRMLESVRRLRDRLRECGWNERALRYREDPDGIHHESAWGLRFREALPFLLVRPSPQGSDSVARDRTNGIDA